MGRGVFKLVPRITAELLSYMVSIYFSTKCETVLIFYPKSNVFEWKSTVILFKVFLSMAIYAIALQGQMNKKACVVVTIRP